MRSLDGRGCPALVMAANQQHKTTRAEINAEIII